MDLSGTCSPRTDHEKIKGQAETERILGGKSIPFRNFRRDENQLKLKASLETVLLESNGDKEISIRMVEFYIT